MTLKMHCSFMAGLFLISCLSQLDRDSGIIGGLADDTATACNEANEDCDDSNCGGGARTMLAGSDCLGCHGQEQIVSESLLFSAAGTVFIDLDGSEPASAAIIRLTDAGGQVIELTSNSVGNFYTDTALEFPIQAEVENDRETTTMTTQPETGSCNDCHACSGTAGGKLSTP